MHDVYTRQLVTVNYSLYMHFKYLCLNLYVYLYLRSFLEIFISLLCIQVFTTLCNTDASDICAIKDYLLTASMICKHLVHDI